MEMLVHSDGSGTSGPSGRQSALDSPILARVERVLLRQDEGYKRDSMQIQRAAYTQSLLSSSTYGKESMSAIKRGLLWQQRDTLFSRWKERYFILTRDYLHCFRRASGSDRISEMGQYLFKVKLADLERVDWENKRTYSTVSLVLGREGKMYLRATDGLEDWFELIEECTVTSKERRIALRHSHDLKSRDNNNVNMGVWLAAQNILPMKQLPSDSVKHESVTVRRREWSTSEKEWERPPLDNRLSLLTDIDINSYDDSTLGAPSITSFRLNQDVLCIQPPSLRGMGSFRSSREAATPTRRPLPPPPPPPLNQDVQFIRFRERSYSDIQRDDRRFWRSPPTPARNFK